MERSKAEDQRRQAPEKRHYNTRWRKRKRCHPVFFFPRSAVAVVGVENPLSLTVNKRREILSANVLLPGVSPSHGIREQFLIGGEEWGGGCCFTLVDGGQISQPGTR